MCYDVTHIVDIKMYPTKKKLKEAMAVGAVYFSDPAIIGAVSGTAEEIIEAKGEFTCTNHPKRSWFARIYRDKKGKIRVQ